jgi:diguanylate cyclase (GGDEF)-like protein
MVSLSDFEKLVHIRDHNELKLYELIPNVVWIFDIDKHGWWWGNAAALEFWGLDSLQALIDKDLSGDTQGARDRTVQTFELALKQGVTYDPWTTYPDGKPKTLMMIHRAVLLGEDKHRGIIAYINEQVNLGEQPENLLLMEAMRYTRIPATTFTLEGMIVVENPSATEAYGANTNSKSNEPDFVRRFIDINQGVACLEKIRAGEEGRWKYQMLTSAGQRTHSLDIRRTRHPLSGEFLFLVLEYDLTELQQALDEVEQAREQLHKIAITDTLTGAYSLHYLQQTAPAIIARTIRNQLQVSLLFIDLDGFKAVNDQFGHDVGDAVLVEVAKRIKTITRSEDIVARLGGDEFVVLLTKEADSHDNLTIIDRILSQLSLPIKVGEVEAKISGSIGVALCPQDGLDLEALLKAADNAMYQVKQTGKNAIGFAESV